MQAPVAPKKNPVIRRLNPSLGIRRAIGEPVPNIRVTRERPTRTNAAVPMNSDRNNRQGIFPPFRSFIMGKSCAVILWMLHFLPQS